MASKGTFVRFLTLSVCLLGSDVERAAPGCAEGQQAFAVYDRSDLRPVPGAVVQLSGAATAPVIARTDGRGIGCVPAGTPVASLLVRHPRYQDALLRTGKRSQPAGPLRITLLPLASLELNVRRDGKAVVASRAVWSSVSGGRHEGQTDSAGRWSGSVGVSGESLEVAVTAEGVPAVCRVVPSLTAGTNRIELDLRGPASITAQVVDASDEPIEAVEMSWRETSQGTCDPVRLIPDRRAAIAVRQAGTAVWTLEGILPGSGMLEIAAPGYARRSLGGIRVPEGGVLDLGTVRLSPRQTVSGTVETASGRRVGGLSVSASRAEHGSLGNVKTDERGRFEIETSGADAVTLRAGDPPGPVGEKEGVRPQARDVTIVVPEPSTIAGEVRSSDQQPVPGATVVGSFLDSAPHERSRFERRAETDERGSFRLEQLRAGRWRIEVRAAGFASAVKAPVELAEGERRDVQVGLSRGTRLQGVVLDASNRQPIEGAVVRTETSHAEEWVSSDDHGRFELGGVSPGVVRILATHPEEGRGTALVDPQAGEAQVLLVRDGAIEGVVEGAGDAPFHGRSVEVQGLALSAETDATGHYRIQGVPAGSHRVVLHESLAGDHGLLQARDVEVPPNDTIQVDFRQTVSVSGRVLWNDEPQRDALVTFTRMQEGRPSGNLTDTLATVRSDDHGEYRIEGLQPGPYTASAKGGGEAIYRSVELEEEEANRVDLVVDGNMLEGIVLDASSGRQIGEAKVVAFDPTRSFGILGNEWWTEDGELVEASQVLNTAWAAYSSFEGHFRLSLPEGRYRLEASAKGYETARREVSVTKDPSGLLEMRLQPSFSLIGAIVDAWGNAVIGAGVAGSCGAEKTMTTLSDAEGFFRIQGLSAGPCVLVAYHAGHGLGFVEAAPSQDRDSLIRIEIRRSGSLRIELRSGASVEDVPILASQAGSPIETLLASSGFAGLRPTFQSRGDGSRTVRYPALPPGAYVLVSPTSGERTALAVHEGEEMVVDLRK